MGKIYVDLLKICSQWIHFLGILVVKHVASFFLTVMPAWSNAMKKCG